MLRGREVWRGRVRRWAASGLTAREFAEKHGLRAGTLTCWRWRLDREDSERAAGSSVATAISEVGSHRVPALAGLIELRPTSSVDSRFEIELACARRLRVPAVFEDEAVHRLLAILERGA
jgi:transposase-like protein